MKKLLLSFVMMLTATITAWADVEVEVDGLRFSVSTGTVPVKAKVIAPAEGVYTGEITIPSSINYNGEDVTVDFINSDAFANATITKVTIPSTVYLIGARAFYHCENLSEITLPEGLREISVSVFAGCPFTSLTLPGTLTRIGSYGLEGLSSLQKLTFAYSEEKLSMDWSVFNGTNNIIELVIDRDYSFGNNTSISTNTVKKVTFGEHVTKIPEYACYDMTLEELNIGANVTAIGKSAFMGCTLPEGYNFPFAQIKEIEEGGFYVCKNLPANIDLTGVEKIEANAFRNSDVQIVKLGSNLTTFGIEVFQQCSNLTTINIPGTINSLESWWFYGCNALTNVTFDYGSTALTLEDGTFGNATTLTIDRTISGTTPFGTSVVTKVALGSHMDSSSALSGLNLSQYTSLNEIELLEGATTIPDNAFQNLSTVTTAILPSTLKKIGNSAFSGCANLTIPGNLPEGLEEIGNDAFKECAKLDVTLPSTLTSIGQSAFSGCTGFTGDLVIPAGVTVLAMSTFYGTGITSVTIPGTVTKINQSDFGHCANLKTVTLLSGEAPLTIGKRCFYSSDNITDVTIDRDFTYYNDLEKNRSPFNTALERVTFGSNVTRVGDRALASCRSLTDVVLPDNITTIGVEAFKWSEPASLTLSKNLTTVEDYGFYGMAGSASLTLPISLNEVGTQAYYDIANLKGVYVPWIDAPIALAKDTQYEKTFSYAADQTLWIPGGTLEKYQAADGWKRFQNFDYWSFMVTADVTGKGTLTVANGEEVTDNGTNTELSLTGAKLVEEGAGEAVGGLFVREKDLVLAGKPARGYKLESVTANGEALTVAKGTAIVSSLLADQTLKATFAPIIYNLTIDMAGGVLAEGQSNPTTYTVEDEAITLVNPTRTGYTFEGWTGTDIEGTAMEVTIAANSIGDRSFVATWKPIVYAITYELNKGKLAEGEQNPDTYTIESADFTLVNPTRNGYTFTGWEGTDLTEKTLEVTVTTGHWGDRSYTATWEPNPYKVTFVANGGEGTMEDQDFVFDTAQNLTANAFTRTGYIFAGWNSKADGTGTAYEDMQEVKNLTSKRDKVVKLYAQWTPIHYTVAFDANNGEGTMEAQSFTYDESQALTASTFTREGYTFKGWNSAADGTGEAYTDGQSVKNLSAEDGATVTVYAQWEVIVYTITYDLAGGSVADGLPDSYTIESNDITLVNPTREGYTFKGWTGTGLDEATMSVTIAKGSTGDRSYTATWELNKYDVTIAAAEGGSVEVTTQTPEHGSTLVITVIPDEGYKFESLIVDGVDVTNEVVDGKYTIESVTGNVSVQASFKQKVRGDVNDDDQVTMADVACIINVIAGGGTEDEKKAADVNGDKVVSVADILAVTAILAGQ